MLYEMLSDVLDVVENELEKQQVILDGSFRDAFDRGLSYGETQTCHTGIDTIKGKKTRKYLHVIVTRMETGRYELVHYIS